jgi:hypothetical protein
MKIVKHFINKTIGLFIAITCRHKETRQSACPFTEREYSICKKCGQIVKSKKIEDWHAEYGQQETIYSTTEVKLDQGSAE